MKRALVMAAALASGATWAQELPPQFGRYRPMYPAMYFTGGYAQTEGDRSFDAKGNERDTATPSSGKSSVPQQDLVATFTWHFPLFESYGIPYVSTHTNLARVTSRFVRTEAEGDLARFARDPSDDAATDADDLKTGSSGIGDTTIEFGTFVLGGTDWRTRSATPLGLLLLTGATIPTGVYEHEAASNAGTNHFAVHGNVGVHWSPWRGGFLDAGATYRMHFANYQPQFGGLAPTSQGDDKILDFSFAQRVLPHLYVVGSLTDRTGDANEYKRVTFGRNAPAAPANTPLTTNRTFPTPGTYRDDGTALRSWGASLQYFITQRWLAALHYSAPISGQSGEFDVAYTNRACLSGGGPGAATCTESPNGTSHEDGLGSARVLASDRLMLTFSFQFGQGDAFDCAGCSR